MIPNYYNHCSSQPSKKSPKFQVIVSSEPSATTFQQLCSVQCYQTLTILRLLSVIDLSEFFLSPSYMFNYNIKNQTSRINDTSFSPNISNTFKYHFWYRNYPTELLSFNMAILLSGTYHTTL